MKTHPFCLAAFATFCLAFPEPGDHRFRAPGPFDSRSPCPGLNALANHGFLPRDGRNIDYELVNEATQTAYGWAPDSFTTVVDMVFAFNISTTDRPNETFHLFDLARHDTIEVDGSLTRNDIYFGDDIHFDATVWAPVAKDLGLADPDPHDRFVTAERAAQATKNRYDLAARVNPEFNNSQLRHATEYGTTALYLLTLWDGENNAAPKSWVKALLGEDRIPYREGYQKGNTTKNPKTLNDMIQALRQVVGWKA